MSSLKTLLFSTLLATTAIATSSQDSWGSGQGGGYGQSSNSWAPSGQQGWTSWSSQKAPEQGSPVVQPVASCPAGCVPFQTSAPPAQQTKAGELIVQVVSVADKNGSLKYFPNNIDAPVGSIVQFQFNPKNHTITESSFADPCKPLASNLTSSTRPGIRSGFIPVKGDEPFTPVYNVLINDTKPIWIFCGQTNHCQKGMAMVINTPKDSPNTIEKYIENAAKLPQVSVAAAPAASSTTTSPPPAATQSSTFTFGGAAPSSSTTVNAPPVQSLPASSAVAPATFTGAASRLNGRDMSFGAAVVGAVVALL